MKRGFMKTSLRSVQLKCLQMNGHEFSFCLESAKVFANEWGKHCFLMYIVMYCTRPVIMFPSWSGGDGQSSHPWCCFQTPGRCLPRCCPSIRPFSGHHEKKTDTHPPTHTSVSIISTQCALSSSWRNIQDGNDIQGHAEENSDPEEVVHVDCFII